MYGFILRSVVGQWHWFAYPAERVVVVSDKNNRVNGSIHYFHGFRISSPSGSRPGGFASCFPTLLWISLILLFSLQTFLTTSMAETHDFQALPHTNVTGDNVTVWFFYSSWCPHCHRVLQSHVLENLPAYASVYRYMVDENSSARSLFDEVVDKYHIPAGVPTAVVFTSGPYTGKVLQGDSTIISRLPALVKILHNETQYAKTNYSLTPQSVGGVTSVSRSLLGDLIFLVGVAASDSINPCIMAVMLIMLATLAAIKDYKRMRLFGITYILCVYISYLVIGVLLLLGSMYLVNQLNMFATRVATVTKWVVAGVLIFAGLVNIKDFFFWGKGITFNINDKHKQRVVELAKKASIAAVISIAIFVTIVEFPCSGIMYLGAIFYWVSQGVNPWQVFSYLLLYNLIFVLPLVVMLWVALAGRKAEFGGIQSATSILMRNKERFRLIMGIALLGLAYFVILG